MTSSTVRPSWAAGAALALTQGDPAGIGPEIIVKAYRGAPELMRGVLVVGQVAVLRRAAAVVAADGPALPVVWVASPADLASVPPRCIPVLDPTPVDEPLGEVPAWGQVSAEAGRRAADAVVWAARAALQGAVGGVVTAPLHKEALHAAGGDYPGHTELLQAEAARHAGVPLAEMPVRMMLANPELRTVLVSIHVSLRDAIEAVTYDNVLTTLRITHAALSRTLGRAPRIGVAGLNPHAGEGGLFGREEVDIIEPAVRAARAQGLLVEGPIAPDTVFMRARDQAQRPGEFDVVVAMYHDQGLIPVKYLGVEQGVNVTLGLPLIRTSPDHGTAFDLAGTGRADASSLIEALRMARQLIGAP
ncbi:4-hydroxythreonine-4-phosphate dehydrogenase PdxA [Curvibacter sp. HBC61]|uniref:4-hydroxythreonine-4-phosphate dehydrogenase PdxA n=1 Tax=Curvibacter cyanobacteriorum TaxID=3026422 RepID=A0ABT5N126_9BURK|nr:4-hydroxythreonine-4-phosphate dehydrogenase PdxA [Curvibacter sp. HBC61]MDD0839211.1 4-hydroxythreonine-4-phosphate dehydrogenase PdxA [Curvibacter sp. HBC61]